MDARITPYTDADAPGLCELMALVAPQGGDAATRLAIWNWRQDNPAGRILCQVARAGDTIAGQFSMYPVRAHRGGREVRWALAYDLAVHPDHRGRSVFLGLVDAFDQTLRDHGVEVTFGRPNINSTHGFYRRLDWVRVEPYPGLMLPNHIPAGRLPAAARPVGLLANLVAGAGARWLRRAGRLASWRAGLEVREATAAPPDADALWTRLAGRDTSQLITDHAWLAWRYDAHPHYTYRYVEVRRAGELVGLSVWTTWATTTQTAPVGAIMEVLVSEDDPATAATLATATLRALDKAGARRVAVYLPVDSMRRRLFHALGFVPWRRTEGAWTETVAIKRVLPSISLDEAFDASRFDIGMGMIDTA